ncbi:MAG TPA: D-alanine--D-alanine ligase family protein [Solirubrobacteraceae bacterium]|nr:D-alanine--D-alanine ligase family protein [Solirubrobacteraceae bacterium]
MPRSGLRVGVVFGGRSVEHDVSIITGLQACEVLDARHQPVPLYIDRHGRWFAGDSLRAIETYRADTLDAEPVVFDIGSGLLRSPAVEQRRGVFGRGGGGSAQEQHVDVVIPATHGTQGEDGCLQGALELADVPYGGPTLEAAVLAMNKAVTKSVLRAAQIPVLEDLTLRRSEYERQGPEAIIAKIKARFGLPVYAKPASLGSSVGVSRCTDEAQLADALQLAFELDRVALVEPAIEGGKEINCAVLGRPGAQLRVSACEQPIASADFLSFEDKYMRDGGKGGAGDAIKSEGMSSADRIIPAPISDELTASVEELSRRTFEVLGCTGVARVDLLLDAQDRLFVNEPNTIPGSFAFYLWEPVGLSFPDLLDELIDIAMAEHAEKQQTTRTFETNLLATRGEGAKA